MNIFEATATINVSESLKQLLLVKELAKQLNKEIERLEIQIECERNNKAILKED